MDWMAGSAVSAYDAIAAVAISPRLSFSISFPTLDERSAPKVQSISLSSFECLVLAALQSECIN